MVSLLHVSVHYYIPLLPAHLSAEGSTFQHIASEVSLLSVYKDQFMQWLNCKMELKQVKLTFSGFWTTRKVLIVPFYEKLVDSGYQI